MSKKKFAKEGDTNDVSIPGVKIIFKSDSSSVLRTAWAVALVLCITFTIYQTIDAFRRYFSYPVEINVEMERQMHLTLPSITFCPGEFLTYLYPDENNNKSWPPTEPHWAAKQQQFHLRNYTITAKIEYSGSSHPVKMNDTEISTLFGVCRLLSYDQPIRYKGSTSFSIFVTYNHSPRSSVYAFFSPSIGNNYENSLLFTLEDKSSYPLHHVFIYSRGPLRKGRKYRFQMTPTQFRSKSFPNKPCEEDVDSYTQCWNTLVNKEITQTVVCKLPFVSTENLNQSICTDSESLVEAYKNVTKIYDSQWVSTPTHCLELCDDVHYHLVKLQEINLSKSLDVEFELDLSENIRQIVTKDFGYTIPQMLSDIGGSLGLFLGCSVLSFLEILQTIGFQLRRAKPQTTKICNPSTE